MTPIPNGIAEELRSEAARQRLTYKDLAAGSGLSYSTVVRKIATEARTLDVGELFRLAQALNTPASEFVRRAEEAQSRKENTSD